MRVEWSAVILFVACVLVACRRPLPVSRGDEAPRPLGEVVHTLADGGPEEPAP